MSLVHVCGVAARPHLLALIGRFTHLSGAKLLKKLHFCSELIRRKSDRQLMVDGQRQSHSPIKVLNSFWSEQSGPQGL